MTQEQISGRKERAENERLIISLNDDGDFRVYSPAYPTRSYTVSGTSDGPKCTCPDYESHKDDPDWKCKHMLAVLNLLNKSTEPVAVPNSERQSVREENVDGTISGLQMHIKRSVSPDGRIDSLSLEVSYPIENDTTTEITEGTQRVLGILADIIEEFKAENGKAPDQRSTSQNNGNGSVPAQMLSVGGMKGKWGGRRLFLNFDVNGQTAKIFGSCNDLAQYIVYAGFPNLAERIAEGTMLNLPCKVIAKPSPDGKYLNIEKVFPIDALRYTRSAAK